MENNPISIRIPENILEKLDKEAEETERSRLAVIRFAIKKYFEEKEK